ncbi:MAG: histidinol dehydrogenase [Candidatus Acidiferrales bacterium]
MKITPLTYDLEREIFARRKRTDRQAERVAAKIVGDVRRRGDKALFEWSNMFGGRVTAESIWVGPAEMKAAARRVSRPFLTAVDHAARNIRRVARMQKPKSWSVQVEPGVRVAQRVEPLAAVGCYIPGGRFSLVSTLLMTVIPAQEAGVKRIVATSPGPGDALLAVASRLGLEGVARIGGAQAVAALAYGTDSIPRVDKICGPGNRYVTAAKRVVSADCAIDMAAGPTEAIVFAERGNAEFMAADLIAQAEHDPDAIALFVTTSKVLAERVARAIERQLEALPAKNLARESFERSGGVLVADSVKEAAEFVTQFAPEHLTLVGDTAKWIDRFPTAGSIFLGGWSAQTFGDYASGTNHVLPTGGVARARAGLSTADFVKCISVQEISRAGFRRLAPVASALADAEGLTAHKRSIEVRT